MSREHSFKSSSDEKCISTDPDLVTRVRVMDRVQGEPAHCIHFLGSCGRKGFDKPVYFKRNAVSFSFLPT